VLPLRPVGDGDRIALDRYLNAEITSRLHDVVASVIQERRVLPSFIPTLNAKGQPESRPLAFHGFDEPYAAQATYAGDFAPFQPAS
jgi:hypothetical protein